MVLNALGSPELADGKYLYSPATGRIEVQWISGIGSEKAAAPQARLMATVINGILSRKLPWGLVMLGVFLVIAVELLGIRSLSFAVGAYLSIGTTLAIFTGGVVRWMVDSAVKKAGGSGAEGDVSPGSLYASGLIAAGGIIGLLGVALKFYETTFEQGQPHRPAPHLPLQRLGLGRGLRRAGVFALLLREEAAEEVSASGKLHLHKSKNLGAPGLDSETWDSAPLYATTCNRTPSCSCRQAMILNRFAAVGFPFGPNIWCSVFT